MKAGDLVADRYRLLRSIGEGGMSSVWAAHHELIGRDVAIKVTGEKLSKRRETRERFLNEARAVGRLRHPNVIDVMDVGMLPEGLLYIVFELLDGRSLEEQLDRKGRIAGGDAASILIDVCRGLEAAHAAGVVHRDLKPANIFLHRASGGNTVIKLLDFGISKTIDDEGVSLSMTQTGVVMGTPQYMSVEQARGRDDIDLRTDIWSAGAILYELVTGRLAFDAANYNAVLDKIMHDEALPLLSSGVNEPGLQTIVSRCLSKQRGQRFQSATELRNALEALLPSLPVTAGALRWKPSPEGSGTRGGDSDPPPPPTDDSPQLRASRQQTTIAAPIPESSQSTLSIPAGSASAASHSTTTRPLESRSSRAIEISVEIERNRLKKRRRIAAAAGALALGAAVAVALPISGGSKLPRASEAPLAVPPITEPRTFAAPSIAAPSIAEEPPRPEPSAATPQRAQPPVAAVSSTPPNNAVAPRKPPSLPRPVESPKTKSITKVDSAGF